MTRAMKRGFAIAILMACNSKAGPAPEPAPPPNAPAARSVDAAPTAPPVDDSILALPELGLYENDRLVMRLHSDGRLEEQRAIIATTEDWHNFAKLEANGTVTSERVHGQLHADGTFHTDEGTSDTLKFDGDAMITSIGRFTIDDAGALLLDGKPDGTGRIEGAANAKAKRTALLMWALALGYVSEKPRPAPVVIIPKKRKIKDLVQPVKIEKQDPGAVAPE